MNYGTAACICVFGLLQGAFGANRIVAKTGGDYPTITAGLSAANPGDTVMVKAGTYTEIVNWPKSGSAAGGAIILKAFGDGPAVISGGTATQNSAELIIISSKNYAAIIGMEIGPYTTASGRIFLKGIQIEGTSQHILIKKCKVHDITTTNTTTNAGANAIGIFGRSASTPVTGVTIDSCEVYGNLTGYSEAISIDGNVDGFIISHNHVHDNNNIGILIAGFYGECSNCGAADQARHGVVSDNVVERCSSCNNPAYKGDCAADGIYSDGGGKSVFERNFISSCDIGIEAGAELAGAIDDSMIVRDNVICNSRIGGMFIGGYETGRGWTVYCQVVNNTFYKNDSQNTGSGEFLIQKAHDNVIRNNIFYTNGQKQAIVSAFNNTYCYNNAVDNNLFFSPAGSTGIDGASMDSHAKSGDPRFANALSGDFRLLNGSPAIDACDPSYLPVPGELDLGGNARKKGTAVDLGAYEYGANASAERQTPAKSLLLHQSRGHRPAIDIRRGGVFILSPDGKNVACCTISGRVIVPVHRADLRNRGSSSFARYRKQTVY